VVVNSCSDILMIMHEGITEQELRRNLEVIKEQIAEIE
tara:strand:- start:285 stop:398 length:114 start_codon:yes stop_codon:yes gene_type:complete